VKRLTRKKRSKKLLTILEHLEQMGYNMCAKPHSANKTKTKTHSGGKCQTVVSAKTKKPKKPNQVVNMG
jgi:hypothetical protein